MSQSKPIPVFRAMLAGFAVLAIAYAVSSPFRSKVDRKVEEVTSWTPKNIESDPEGYLTHAKSQINSALTALQSAKIELAQKKAKTTALLVEQAADRDAVESVFNELRSAYKAAEESSSWPAEVNGTIIPEGALRDQIIEAHSRLKSLNEQTDLVAQAKDRLDARERELTNRENDLNRTLRKIDADLEIVRTTETLESLDAITVDLASLEAVSSVLAAQPEEGSLDSMIESRKAEAGRASFEEILNAD